MVHNLDISSLVWAPATLAEFFCGILAACWATILWGGASACQPWIATLFQALKICIKFSEKLSNWFCILIILVLYIFFRKNDCCLYLMGLLCCKIQLSIKAYIWFFVVLVPRHWYLGRDSTWKQWMACRGEAFLLFIVELLLILQDSFLSLPSYETCEW